MAEVLTQTAPARAESAGKAMITSTQIARRVHEMGRQISRVYADIETPLVLVVILKGATVFAADLLRSLSIPAELEFVRAASYGSSTTRGPLKPLKYTVEGSDGQQIIPELAPKPGDVVVRKYRSSGFWGTNLDMLLRSNGIKSIVVTGATTEGCVESTARDGLFNDYYVIVPEDCVASDDPAQHDASMLLMRHRFDVVPSSEILEMWSSAASA